MVKILENTYRAVNIGLVNEMAQICHRIGLDIWEVIAAASTKPLALALLSGTGVGRPLHPHRPALSDMEDAQSECADALYQRLRGKHRHATVRGARSGCAQ